MVSSLFKYYFIPHLMVGRINDIFLDVKISSTLILPSMVYTANDNFQRMKHPGPKDLVLLMPPKSPSIPLYKRGSR